MRESTKFASCANSTSPISIMITNLAYTTIYHKLINIKTILVQCTKVEYQSRYVWIIYSNVSMPVHLYSNKCIGES